MAHNKVLQRRMGGLDVLEVPGSDDGPVVVMLHGYGASWQDLLPLHREIAAPPGTTWIFPNAPQTVNIGPFSSGRAWFQIDMDALNRAMMAGTHRDMSGITPQGLSEARELVLNLLADLGRPLDRVVLGGFSQGAMVCTEVALTAPLAPAGLVLMSATLLHETVWRQAAPARAGLRFVQSHGRQDPLLGVAEARRLHTLLTDAGLKGDLLEFNGQHEIPPVVLNAVGAFITGLPCNEPTGRPATQ